MKIITVCGSLRFKDEMMQIAEQIELEGNVALIPIIPARKKKEEYTAEEIGMLGKMHKERIKLSDGIFVVNVDNYVGSATQSEIDFARALNKEITYLVKR